MIQKIKVPVSVVFFFEHTTRRAEPVKIVWNGRQYSIVKVGLHHSYRLGRTLYHVFSVSSKTLFFRLVFNTGNLSWTLEETNDGLSN